MGLFTHRQALVGLFLIFTFLGTMFPLALASTQYERVYSVHAHKYVYVPVRHHHPIKHRLRSAWRNPIVKNAAIGAGAGAGLGLVSHRTSVGRGVVVGAGTGALVGVEKKNRRLARHPAGRSALEGATIGTGIGLATHHSLVKGAVVGGAAGLGVHYISKYIHTHHD